MSTTAPPSSSSPAAARRRWALVPFVALGIAGVAAGCGSSQFQAYCDHAASCLVAAGVVPSDQEQNAADQCASAADSAANGAAVDQSKLACLDNVACSVIVTCSTTQDCSGLSMACP
jgi:hypothetical protein